MENEFDNLQLKDACRNLMQGETNLISSLANIASLIHTRIKPKMLWTGFYLVNGEQLELGPFQGPVACTKIKYGHGVCGKAWSSKSTIMVDNVNEFEGHIACSSLSNSEIVIPIISHGEVKGVLDIDSEKLAAFNKQHQQELELICELIAKQFFN